MFVCIVVLEIIQPYQDSPVLKPIGPVVSQRLIGVLGERHALMAEDGYGLLATEAKGTEAVDESSLLAQSFDESKWLDLTFDKLHTVH